MKTVKGDLLNLAGSGCFDVIVHGCNCFCTMEAGIAQQIKNIFPEAFKADRQTKNGDRHKLGTFSSATAKRGGYTIVIVNAYTQYKYDGNGVLADYQAIKEVFAAIKNKFTGRRIAYPKIGAGLAQGDWEVIAGIIDREMGSEDHTLVERPAG